MRKVKVCVHGDTSIITEAFENLKISYLTDDEYKECRQGENKELLSEASCE